MCFYLQTVRKMEVLQMNCDFFMDDDGGIWLFYIEDVLWRPVMKTDLEINEEKQILENIMSKKKEQKLQAKESREELKKIMKATYEKIDKKSKIYDEKYKKPIEKDYR